jgi:hypothetical protein
MPHGTGVNSSHNSVSERRDVEVGEQEPILSKFVRKASISNLEHATVFPNCSVFKNKR